MVQIHEADLEVKTEDQYDLTEQAELLFHKVAEIESELCAQITG